METHTKIKKAWDKKINQDKKNIGVILRDLWNIQGRMTSLNILELKRDVWAGDTDLRDIITYVICGVIETEQGCCIHAICVFSFLVILF